MTILYVWMISIILCFVGALVHKRRAEAQIQERAGRPPHRSWWVAEKGIETVKKANGKIELVLKNGLTAPVSRSGRAQVSEAGWI